MLPSQIPRSFCLAQTFIVSFSALLLTGVGLTVILAVSTAVIWPSSINASPQSYVAYHIHLRLFSLIIDCI